jgi:hypothetical protein
MAVSRNRDPALGRVTEGGIAALNIIPTIANPNLPGWA